MTDIDALIKRLDEVTKTMEHMMPLERRPVHLTVGELTIMIKGLALYYAVQQAIQK